MQLSASLVSAALMSISGVAQTADLSPALVTATNVEPTFRLQSNLVIVPASVTDAKGRFVQDLQQSNFSVTDEKTPQQIISFSHEYAPVSVGIVFDTSGSMKRKAAQARAAVREFLRTVERDDEMFLVTFSDKPELRTEFTSDDSTIVNELLLSQPRGATALFDAVALAIRYLRSAKNPRKVLLVISDGGDNHSRLSGQELGRILEETDVQIHALGLPTGGSGCEELRGRRILEFLAGVTGGAEHTFQRPGELPEWAAKLSLSLHDRYVLTYRPPAAAAPDKWRNIRVTLKGVTERYQVYARNGYRTK